MTKHSAKLNMGRGRDDSPYRGAPYPMGAPPPPPTIQNGSGSPIPYGSIYEGPGGFPLGPPPPPPHLDMPPLPPPPPILGAGEGSGSGGSRRGGGGGGGGPSSPGGLPPMPQIVHGGDMPPSPWSGLNKRKLLDVYRKKT